MNIKGNTQVLPIFHYNEHTGSSKMVSVLILLVPLFINGGTPRNTIAALQAFIDDFIKKIALNHMFHH